MNIEELFERLFNFEKQPVRVKKNKTKGHVIAFVLTVVLFFIIDYITLPAWNLRSPGFLLLIAFIIAVWATLDQILTFSQNKYATKAYGVSVLIVLIVMTLGLLSSEFLNAARYRDQITIREVKTFSSDFETVELNRIPVVDKQTAIQLGEKQIGTVASLGSQFFVQSDYSLISIQDQIYRVTALDYRDPIKWLNNRREGIKNFVMVNVTNPNDVRLMDYEAGMKYTPSAYLNDQLIRHVRFNHRSAIIGGYSLEVDDAFNPYWVVSVVSPEIGWFGGLSAQGVIIVDPSSGDSNYYDMEDIPSWVDRVQPSNIAWSQIDNWGYYVNGFFNTLFSQKDMLQTTDGYNYVSIDGQVYVYSGLTSVGSDRSIVGFALINLRTKEATFYEIGGADEYSAMSSAQGQVQHLNYRATFPVLLNIGDVPTYFISLKDQEGLVKMYSFVAVSNYDAVGVGENIQAALNDYSNRLSDFDIIIDEPSLMESLVGTVGGIYSVIEGGNTVFYITMNEDPRLFRVVAKDHIESIFLSIDDQIEVGFYESDELMIDVIMFDHLGVNYNP